LALFLGWNERSARLKALALFSAAILISGTVLTYSRGAWVAMAFQTLFLLVFAKLRWRFATIALAALLLFGVLAVGESSGRLTTLRQLLPGSDETLEPDSSFEERRLFTLSAWEMFLDHPWLGVGAGNYTEYFEEYSDRVGSPARSYDAPGAAHYPHNLYLGIAAETGTLGLAVFLAIVATAFGYLVHARSAFLNRGDSYMAGMALAMQIALSGYLVSSFFLHGHYLRYLWLIFAFAAALYVVARAKSAAPWPVSASQRLEGP
jgi:O-antigen ligase